MSGATTLIPLYVSMAQTRKILPSVNTYKQLAHTYLY